MNVKPLLNRGAFAAAVLVVTPLVAADLSEVADLKPLAMKAYGIRSVERKGDNTLVVNGADGKPLVLAASGGHHDAGDYNPRSHIDVAQSLLDAYELKPGNFYDRQLSVPERSNSIPDIVDEAMWAARVWAGLAGIAPPDRARRLAAALEDPATFAAPCGTRSLAKGDFGYEPDGGNYWRGGVWCITDWMIVRGLYAYGLSDVAHRLACRHVLAIASVHADTGTIWESYDPERLAPGKLYGQLVRREFVGFSGVTPIAMLVRDVFGIDVTPGRIVWKVRLLERHGIENLTLPDGNVVSLICEQRKSADEKPVVHVTSTRPIEVKVEQ